MSRAERDNPPEDAVVWCENCQRWTVWGEPYDVSKPGVFRHRHCLYAVPDEEIIP